MTSHQLGYAVTLPNSEIDAAIAVGLAHPDHLGKEKGVGNRKRLLASMCQKWVPDTLSAQIDELPENEAGDGQAA